MTIDQLICELQRRKLLHGGSTEVTITWEGVFREIDLNSIYLGKNGDLFIDADGNYYKDEFQHPDDKASNPVEA